MYAEEDSTTDEAQEKSVQEPTNANAVKEENHVVPAGESKDYHEKVKGLDCDDRKGSGDTHDHNQTSDEAGLWLTNINMECTHIS
jgi:hypothetical protein